MGKKPPLLKDTAARISAHLARFERDPKLNPMDVKYGTRPYYGAGAYQGGAYVRVRYVSYQGATSLARAQAEKYLAWLDAGNVGQHWKSDPEKTPGHWARR